MRTYTVREGREPREAGGKATNSLPKETQVVTKLEGERGVKRIIN